MSTTKKIRIGVVLVLALTAIVYSITQVIGLSPKAQQSHADATPMRIVTAGGNVTEMVYELGLGAQMVATDSTSTYPEAAQSLPKIGYQRTLSVEGVLGQKPDLLILSGEAGPPAVIEQLKSTGLKVLVLPKAHTLENIQQSITLIGQATGKLPQSQQLIERMTRTLNDAQVAQKKQGARPLKALFVMSHTGALTAAGKDTAADAMMHLAGLKNIAHDAFIGYKALNAESLIESAPDVILTTSEGLTGMGGVDGLLARIEFAHTPAGQHKQVIAMPAMYLLGFGPRQAQALLDLHQQLEKIQTHNGIP